MTAETPASASSPITVETCTVVRCAACGDGHNEDIGTPHFANLDQAKRDLEGWDWTAPDRPTCADCTAEAVCAAQGHDWSPWEPSPTTATEWRYCERSNDFGGCGAYERRPVASPDPGALS